VTSLPQVQYWINLNEPGGLIPGYLHFPWLPTGGSRPPGVSATMSPDDQIQQVRRLIRNLFRAHTEARRAITKERPDAMVGVNPEHFGVPRLLEKLLFLPARVSAHLGQVLFRRDAETSKDRTFDHQTHLLIERPATTGPNHPLSVRSGILGSVHIPFLDAVTARWTEFYDAARFMATRFASDWWYQGMEGKLPLSLCPDDCRGQLDFVGLDYYWGASGSVLTWESIADFANAISGNFEDAPVQPHYLTDYLKDLSRRFPTLPILICENGCVKETEGVTREDYIRQHICAVQAAVQWGANVIGYLYWSMTSVPEWGLAFGPENDFGLYYIDLTNDASLIRQWTPTVDVYSTIIHDLGVNDCPS
jgi:hypothetical protein